MIEATAPVRICDNGGWTDTWFGGPGRVVNIAVTPGVEVSIRTIDGPPGIVLAVDAFGDRYAVVPNATRRARHPLLEAAIDTIPPPDDVAVEVRVRSAVPAGCGAGTSAAVAVALLGALSAVRSEAVAPHDLAVAAHRLEVDVLGVESGIQDQMSAAFGGVNYLEIEPYPEVTVETLPAWDELGSRLTLVFLGRPHDSSDVHLKVIESLNGHASDVLDRLRDAAIASRDAVIAQDLGAFGRSMIANTEAQRRLHPDLIGADAEQVIAMAAERNALGWKVNGAGGDGGSITILSATPAAKAEWEPRLGVVLGGSQVLPVEMSPVGFTVRGSL